MNFVHVSVMVANGSEVPWILGVKSCYHQGYHMMITEVIFKQKLKSAKEKIGELIFCLDVKIVCL